MTDKINGFKQAMQKVEQDFRTNTLEKTLERLGINPDCLSESFKEELKAQPEVEVSGTICPRAGVIIGTLGAVVGDGTTCPIGAYYNPKWVETKLIKDKIEDCKSNNIVLNGEWITKQELLKTLSKGNLNPGDCIQEEDGDFYTVSGDSKTFLHFVEYEKPELNPEDYRLTKEENDLLNSIEPPEDLF